MSITIAIVGRPNVGKSTLFNRLVGRQKAIVEDRPGVTRDRLYGIGRHEDRTLNLIDTGGFDPNPDDALLKIMKQQVELAMEEADVIWMVMDARSGLTPVDEEIHRLLLRQTRPVYFVCNKVDGAERETDAGEFYRLGVQHIYCVSATQGRGLESLLDDVVEPFPRDNEIQRPPFLHVAIVGKPNVGKSTLVNQLIGENRLLTSEMPGTTRDSVDMTFTAPDGREYVLVDTAGIRKKSSVKDHVEYYSVVRAVRSIERADVVLLLIDGFEGMQEQDARIAQLVEDRGKAMAIVFNKWDLVRKTPKTAQEYTKRVKETYPSFRYVPTAFTSALSGKGTTRLFPLLERLKESWEKRISTGVLNRFVEECFQRTPPPSVKHRVARFYYATQAGTCPPTFVFQVNSKDLVPLSYQRFLLNRLREEYGFEGTPVRVHFRGRQGKGNPPPSS